MKNCSLFLAILLVPFASCLRKKSVRPGVNDTFRDPNVKEFIEKFEIESREVFAKREEIVKQLGIKPGVTVADVGAGTAFSLDCLLTRSARMAKSWPSILPRTFLNTSTRSIEKPNARTCRLFCAQPTTPSCRRVQSTSLTSAIPIITLNFPLRP